MNESGESSLKKAGLLELKRNLVLNVQRDLAVNTPEEEKYRQTVAQLLQKEFRNTNIQLDDKHRDYLLREVFNELVGYGPIQPFLEDSTITEIMAVGPSLVYIERNGELIETKVKFDDERHLLRIINRIIHPLGRRVDADSPAVDARLPDGSRVHAIIPPVAVDGPCMTIRKFLQNMMTIEELMEMETISEYMAEFLQACVAARLNIVI